MISTTFITPLTSMPTVSSLDKDSNNLSSNEENSELSFSETLQNNNCRSID